MVKNKGTHCVTLAPDIAEKIDSVGKGKSFSAKLAYIIMDYCADRGILVQYLTEEERQNGTPKILIQGAERVWAWCSWLKGPEEHLAHQEAEATMREWAVGAKSRKMKPRDVATGLSQRLQESGYSVQVIDLPEEDILEVWISKKEREPECDVCRIVQRIRRVLEVEV